MRPTTTNPRTIKIAAVQMDAAPAPTAERLSRAADLVAEAAAAGAQLVALPEVFNTGYEYSDANYALAETMDGATVAWMRRTAAEHGIHLAGTLLLRDGDEVYNTALLIAPDGRTWRYDKQYPYAWERAYFREGQGITVADTDLGKLGMMICWDSAHPDLWRRYAGQVQAMVVLSCPPLMHKSELVFPDGERVGFRQLGGVFRQTPQHDFVFGEEMDRNAAWLQVPLVNTTGSGQFRSRLPAPLPSLMSYTLFRPDLWKKLKDAPEVRLENGYFMQTKVVSADGQVLSRVTDDGDGFTLAEVTLPDAPPQPQAKTQPRVSVPGILTFMIDYGILPFIIGKYREGLRRQWGARMAPRDPRTVIWTGVAAAAGLLGFLIGRLLD
jgi:hypothetical protein